MAIINKLISVLLQVLNQSEIFLTHSEISRCRSRYKPYTIFISYSILNSILLYFLSQLLMTVIPLSRFFVRCISNKKSGDVSKSLVLVCRKDTLYYLKRCKLCRFYTYLYIWSVQNRQGNIKIS